MEYERNKKNLIRITKFLLPASTVFFVLCLALLWFFLPLEVSEKPMTTIVFVLFIWVVVALFFIFRQFIKPLNRYIEQQMDIGTVLEEKYRQSLNYVRQLATAVEQTADSVIITDIQGKILYVNPAFCHLTGYSSMESIGNYPSMIKSGTTPHTIYQDLWKTILSGDIWRGEFKNKKKDGSFYWEEASIAPIVHEDGQIHGFVGVRRDVTEKKANAKALQHLTVHLEEEVAERTAKLHQAVQEAEAANQAKSDFLANMSHELRTPLHAIRSLVNMILKKSSALMNHMDTIDDPTIIHYLSNILHLDRASWEAETHLWLGRILDNQKRQLDLVNTLLELAKLGAGKANFKFKNNDLLKTVRGSLEELESLLKEKSIGVTIVAEKVNTKISMDQDALGRVIKNIVGNALKFTPAGGKITVSLKAGSMDTAAALVLTIRDTGIGIPDNELASIFEPFVQSTRAEGPSSGSGLGLALCREIIIAHCGTIQASNHPEGGSVFTLVLPRKIPTKTL